MCYLDASNLDHEHGGAQDVAGVVTPELDACDLLHFVEVDGLDLLHALLQVRLGVQHVVCGDVTVTHIITPSHSSCVLQ